MSRNSWISPSRVPLTDPEQVVVDGDKAKQWIKNGAQPTETVRGLFKKHGVID